MNFIDRSHKLKKRKEFNIYVIIIRYIFQYAKRSRLIGDELYGSWTIILNNDSPESGWLQINSLIYMLYLIISLRFLS